MLYSILNPFREYLKNNLSPNTAEKYFRAAEKLFSFENLEMISDLSSITPEWILQKTNEKFKTKSEYSAVKNGLKWLSKFEPTLRLPSEENFLKISEKKRNRSKRPKKTIYLNPMNRKINQIRDDRLRYAYRLAEISGLRVSELADLKKEDIFFENGRIFVNVKNGKGGHGGVIECMEDTYLLARLPEFLKRYNTGEKIFYAAETMIKKAGDLGMECHDLRRVFAIRSREELKKNMPLEEANVIVQQKMRHVRFSTTKRYLFNRKLKFEYEKEEEKEQSADFDNKKKGGV